ncbi:hypothetical protein MPTK1_4g18350 [Marchantia polymorpha subsp. ruderalis]|uniref:Uncharacterized protein n=2 Tax=Marchantia polymorpha TaxID=3197 RepID=A0AAF6BB83_MARPO|nr:hypothetical protein MARPO_0041s0116 [Marchantia polymorpha]BBN09267.1 hypothetical protein Mp_4g18350 [Marchantia polymorpha subsp. ruderalis]|eukprot:PTQ40255.1 hypothetical protein MARPO_0041s0116 [Marchantia polymorpha]
MADSLQGSLEEDDSLLDALLYNNGKQNLDLQALALQASMSKSEGKSTRRKSLVRPSLETEDLLNLLHGSDPVKVELNRLENEVRDKDRELCEAQAEIKALKLTERLREKAVEEVSEELLKVDAKLKASTIALENKNLEVKRINDEKKAALVAQYAAEATLRRVHAAQKDDDMPPIEAILAPLESEIKIARQEIGRLQEHNRALDRMIKSKEAALLEAERTVQVAEAKASMVDDLQNRNQELLKQIEIYQEENKILDKMHRQKVAEVEKMSTTVAELEEALLAGGAAANAVRDHQRQVHELTEEKKTLERELARAKITANRVAVVVANEWKDQNDKVMPVRQWLEERRFMQGEMQQLRDKLTAAERTAKNESQLKEKLQLRLKVLEDGLRSPSTNTVRRTTGTGSDEAPRSGSNGPVRRQSTGTGSEEAAKLLANGSRRLRTGSVSQLRASVSGTSQLFKNGRLSSKSFDAGRSVDGGPGVTRAKAYTNGFEENHTARKTTGNVTRTESDDAAKERPEPKTETSAVDEPVSGLLYDMLQKEVISLRKSSHEKDQSLKDKDDAIEMLSKKVDTLTKAMEVEAKKMRREFIAMEKEVAAMRIDKEQETRARRVSMAKERVHNSHSSNTPTPIPGRVQSEIGKSPMTRTYS